MTSTSPIRVLVADPFPMSARGVLAVLDQTEDLRLVGSVHHAHSFRLVRQLDVPFFDVVLIDAHSVGGTPALRALIAAYPRAVVVYTFADHPHRRRRSPRIE
jgi:DNA-binding NarL/FixJ family response regulator